MVGRLLEAHDRIYAEERAAGRLGRDGRVHLFAFVQRDDRYLDLLEATFMVRTLQPWHENLAKRQVKAPKVYLADSGLLHTLLDIDEPRQLFRHPKVGASWEGFCIDAVLRRLGARRGEAHFWATHAGAELDLLVVRGRRRLGFEVCGIAGGV